MTDYTKMIKTLRWCGGENNEWCVGETYKCPLWHEDRITDDCKAKLMTTAADALEAAEKRIVNLLTALHLANEKLAYVDCQPYTEIDGEEMIDDWVKTLVYEELHTQKPKEGEWKKILQNGDGTSDYQCSACLGIIENVPDDDEHPLCSFCPNCGARMRGEHDE